MWIMTTEHKPMNPAKTKSQYVFQNLFLLQEALPELFESA